MKRIMYLLAIAVSALCLGCGKSDGPVPPSEPYTPSAAEYKALLEKRVSSPGGANINIRQEVGKFENASAAEKRELYNKVNSLVK